MSKRQRPYFYPTSKKRKCEIMPTETNTSEKRRRIGNFNINVLPDTIFVQIFEHLSALERIRIERVCKRWNCLSKYSWTKFRTFNKSNFEGLHMSRCRQILTLDSTFSQVLKLVASRCSKYLTMLDFEGIRGTLNEEVLSSVSYLCPNLILIEFNSMLIPKHSLRLSLNRLSFDCPYLVSVSFDGCFPKDNVDAELSNFFRKCLFLKLLDISNNRKITGNCFVDLPQDFAQLYLSKCFGIEDRKLLIVANRCSDLELLKLTYCNQFTTGTLETVFQKLTKLTNLDLAGINAVSDEMLDIVTANCRGLETLDISDCFRITDAGLSYLCRLQHLVYLDLTSCNRISDIGVKKLAKLGLLQVLYLQCCDDITDDSVIELAECCLNLKKLHLFACDLITDATVWAFYDKASLRTVPLMLSIYDTGVTLNQCDVDHPMLVIEW